MLIYSSKTPRVQYGFKVVIPHTENKYLDTTITYNHLSSLSFIAFSLPFFNSFLSIDLNFKNHHNASCAYYADKIKNCNNSRSFTNTFNILFCCLVSSCPLAKLSFPFHLIHFSFNFSVCAINNASKSDNLNKLKKVKIIIIMSVF